MQPVNYVNESLKQPTTRQMFIKFLYTIQKNDTNKLVTEFM